MTQLVKVHDRLTGPILPAKEPILIVPKRMSSHHNFRTQRRNIKTARRTKVSYLMRCGYSPSQISREIGIPEYEVNRDIKRVLEVWRKFTLQNVQQLMNIDVARLETLILKYLPQVNSPDKNVAAKAATIVVSAIREKSKIIGYDQFEFDETEFVRRLALDHGYNEEDALEVAHKLKAKL